MDRGDLKPLPPSNDKYWEYSEIKLTNIDAQSVKCEHYFELISSTQIKCKKCGVGYFIGMDDMVRDGHLFHADKLVI